MFENLPDVIGHALRDQRAGLENITFNRMARAPAETPLEVTSTAFRNHGAIPVIYTADGEGIFPPIAWTGVPDAARSLVMIVEDADSPTPHPLVHAIVAGIARDESQLHPGALEDAGDKTSPHVTGRNSLLQANWLPPDPPPGHGVHRYAFQLFALSNTPEFSDAPGRDEIHAAIEDGVVARGCLIGTYERAPAIAVPLDEAIGEEPGDMKLAS